MANNDNDTTVYTATFELSQEGMDGMVTPKVTFSHELDPDEAPAIYELMSNVALDFLREVNIIDENNEIISFEEATATHSAPKLLQ